MITVICTTNRTDSNTLKLAQEYVNRLQGLHASVQLLDLRKVPAQWIEDSSFGANIPEFNQVVEKYIRNADKIVLVMPEYNGGFPGYLKFFMDACDHGDWRGKKVAMMGLATGRSGNVRGVDQMTGILHYLGSEVYSKKVYLSQVNGSLSETGELTNPYTIKELTDQLNGFLSF
jgi:NAD(P)H-dependent FMN reductase